VSNPQSDARVAVDAGQAVPPGVMLRHAREARGESLAEVAQALKLSVRQLDALESGRHEALPGPAFVRGFLRNYARHLGIDPEPVLAALGSGAPASVDLTPVSNAEGDMPTGAGARFNLLPAGLVAALLLAVMFAGNHFGWFATQEAPLAVVEPVDAPVFEPGQPVPGNVAVDVPPDTASEPQAVVDGPAGMAQSAAPPTTGLPPAVPATGSAVAPQPAPPVATGMAPAAVDTAEASGAGGLRFVFAGESWIEVRDARGAVLFSGVGTSGSSRVVQGQAPFALVVGNARSVSLEYNGKPVDLVPHTRVSVARLTVQ